MANAFSVFACIVGHCYFHPVSVTDATLFMFCALSFFACAMTFKPGLERAVASLLTLPISGNLQFAARVPRVIMMMSTGLISAM